MIDHFTCMLWKTKQNKKNQNILNIPNSQFPLQIEMKSYWSLCERAGYKRDHILALEGHKTPLILVVWRNLKVVLHSGSGPTKCRDASLSTERWRWESQALVTRGNKKLTEEFLAQRWHMTSSSIVGKDVFSGKGLEECMCVCVWVREREKEREISSYPLCLYLREVVLVLLLCFLPLLQHVIIYLFIMLSVSSPLECRGQESCFVLFSGISRAPTTLAE